MQDVVATHCDSCLRRRRWDPWSRLAVETVHIGKFWCDWETLPQRIRWKSDNGRFLISLGPPQTYVCTCVSTFRYTPTCEHANMHTYTTHTCTWKEEEESCDTLCWQFLGIIFKSQHFYYFPSYVKLFYSDQITSPCLVPLISLIHPPPKFMCCHVCVCVCVT